MTTRSSGGVPLIRFVVAGTCDWCGCDIGWLPGQWHNATYAWRDSEPYSAVRLCRACVTAWDVAAVIGGSKR